MQNPVIVVPGVTATYLVDHYPVTPETVWTVMRNNFERAALHPDNLRYEAIEPARLLPGQIYEVAYTELIDELRHNLSPTFDAPVPVFPFAYDWRKPLVETQEILRAFVREVAERTRLLRHYHAAGYDGKVDLVGHSMGGLIIAGMIAAKAEPAVGKVATLATPYAGSYEAVVKLITGTADLGGGSPPSSREREAARVTPSLYHLLPDIPNGIIVGPGLPTESLFAPDLWQPSILASLAEFIRRVGVAPLDPPTQARDLFATLLAQAKAQRESIKTLVLNERGLDRSDWLCVAGVDAVTRVTLEIQKDSAGQPQFALTSAHRKNGWNDTDPWQTGDGTVPLRGALPPFLPPEAVVCIRPDDFGYWEIQDRLVTKAAGFHGILPNMNMLHRLLVRFFTGAEDRHRNTWGRPLPGVTNWQPPLPLTLKP